MGKSSENLSHSDSHHHDPLKQPLEAIPDYKTYKLEDAPELVKVQKSLSELGLKDPWVRNYVFMYNPKIAGTYWSRVRSFLFYGLSWGVSAFVVTVIGYKIRDYYYPTDPHEEHMKTLRKYGLDPYKH
ncbi:unnamed protein product [Gordionus sp. m RMFG-2023]|uniref:NADH dehydrogenase [ubiquinone] 1 beta subcomplex subunit 3-like n=1 Tax=Gordionus sp. m RMFG-2023 TaxID=3053472 RepID=UPI0030DEF436